MMSRPVLPEVFLKAPIAHRGLHNKASGIPENSRAAFQAAIDAGYGIELDIQASRDDTPLVFHDYDMKRLTGTAGPIRQCTAKESRALKLVGNDESVPTFREVLDLVAGQVPILAEIKDQDGAMGPNTGTLEKAVADELRSYSGPVALMSFNPHSVAALAEFAPEFPRGIVTEAWSDKDSHMIPESRKATLREIPDFERVGACFISHQASDLERARVRELKDQGAFVLCWTIRSAEAEARARKIADNITFEGYTP